MKIIETTSFRKMSSDFKDYPTLENPLPMFNNKDKKKNKKKKKKKLLPQLGLVVDDVSINELR